MCQFSGIFKGILGSKCENQGDAPFGGHFEFLTKSKVYWCKGGKTQFRIKSKGIKNSVVGIPAI